MRLDPSRQIVIACLLGVCLAVPVASADDWSAGKLAFSDGDYESALLLFEAAQRAGRSGPAIRYNIAVTQYKTGRYSDAYASFELIAEQFPEKRALAEYNMGLAATRLDEPDRATAHFRRAYDLSGSDQVLKELASRQLRESEPNQRAASRWSGAFGLRAGYDDNVTLLDEAALSPGTTTDSSLGELHASIAGRPTERDDLLVEGSAYLVNYFDAGDFDQTLLSGGVIYQRQIGDWRIRGGIQASASTLGSDSYDRKVGPKASLTRYLDSHSSVEVRFRYDDVSEGDSLYAGLAGSRQILDARYRWYDDLHYVQLRYTHESNDRDDAGVSPDRNRLRADYRYEPGNGLGFEASAAFRTSKYDDIALPREEDLTILRGTLTYRLRNDWLVFIEVEHANNDSSNPVFSYDRNLLTLGARRFF